jgi:alkanesulfonate monooxygenase SsuD/methylene tetrahydromethanopterin reductase-like flavin-dependent oxidoreductase (luciferase family)
VGIRLGYQMPNFSYGDSVEKLSQHLNIICSPSELPRKIEALDARRAEAGRDRSTLETSFLAFVMIDEDGDRAREQQKAMVRAQGGDPDAMSDEEFPATTERMFVGTPDDVAADLQARVLDQGVDGLVINLPATGHVEGAVELAGRTLRPLVGA